jgi:hypothetical protein
MCVIHAMQASVNHMSVSHFVTSAFLGIIHLLQEAQLVWNVNQARAAAPIAKTLSAASLDLLPIQAQRHARRVILVMPAMKATPVLVLPAMRASTKMSRGKQVALRAPSARVA